MNKYNALNAEYDQLYPVTKIKNVDGLDTALQSKPNPNLLDNWYFSNPVDQRGGYVALPGITYFDTWGGPVAGVTDKYYTATHTPGGYDDQYQITVNGAVKYVPVSSCVRGYTGSGYGIDRFIQKLDSGVVQVTSNGIVLSGSDCLLHQIIEFSQVLVGATVTLSVLTADNHIHTCTGTVTDSADTNFAVKFLDSSNSNIAVISDSSKRVIVQIRTRGDNTYTIKAVKLELGNTQTLAHQDENGNWVLNEIPDYGEQLARCQRYFQKYDNYIWFTLCKDNLWRANFNFPVTMREAPTVEFEVTANKETNVVFDKRTKNGISGYSTSDADYIAVTNLIFNAEL